MPILDIEFEWPVATCGYVVREVKAAPAQPRPSVSRQVGFFQVQETPPQSLLANSGGIFIAPRCTGAELRAVRPLALNPNLYIQFARLEDEPSAFAHFATSWGFLSGWSYDNPNGESVHFWRANLKTFQAALSLAERDPRHLLHFPPEGGGYTQIEPHLAVNLVWTGRLSLRLTPRNLLQALWLQFWQSMTQGGEIKNCDQCGAWFERGPGTDRSRKARFCSDACRFGFHNQRRGKGGSA